jgi:hypothetical protein
VSRNGHCFASFSALTSSIASSMEGPAAIFDGEIVCVDRKGRPRFNDLLFRRGEARFFAFDLLHLDGKDLRYDAEQFVRCSIPDTCPKKRRQVFAEKTSRRWPGTTPAVGARYFGDRYLAFRWPSRTRTGESRCAVRGTQV